MTDVEQDGPRSPYGWSKPERLLHLSKFVGAAGPSHRLMFQDQELDLKVILVPVGLPKYRLANGRTAALQEEHIAANGLASNFFRLDQERLSAQEIQHELLKSMISEQGLIKYFENPQNRQSDPIILDADGFVLNGNRRLCTFRELTTRDPNQYRHFENVRAIVLPPADERALDRLEAQLQLSPALRSDYSWYAEAQMMRDRMEFHKLSILELASFYDKKKSDIEDLLQMHSFAAEYLKSRGHTSEWSRMRGKNEFAFRQLIKAVKNLPGPDSRLIQEMAFVAIDDPAEGRLYEEIPKLRTYHLQLKEQLLVEFPLEEIAPREIGDRLDPLSPSMEVVVDPGYQLAERIREGESRKRAASVIREVVRSEEELKREQQSNSLLLIRLQRVHALLVEGVNSGMTADAQIEGVSAQLTAIEAKLTVIRRFLDSRPDA